MINTLQIKKEQFKHGAFKVGNGATKILIIGSCRAVPYVTYFNDYNHSNSNKFTIYFIDPFNWNWDMEENRVDYKAELIKQESNAELIEILNSCDIFIHEYYNNAEMFNCDKNAEKNIYQFGLKPSIDITLPNYNDIFILTREIVSFDLDIRKMATQDYNVNGKLSDYTLQKIDIVRQKNLQKFYDICSKSDFPEFAEIFANSYKQRRLFWTFNHTAKDFNKELFLLMNRKFFNLDMRGYKFCEIDLYANNFTYLCEYDEGFKWHEEVKPLRDIL